MGIISQMPVLQCDICGKKEETTTYSCNYDMYNFSIGKFHQIGFGESPYQLHDKKEKVCCNNCVSKMINASEVFRKLLK